MLEAIMRDLLPFVDEGVLFGVVIVLQGKGLELLGVGRVPVERHTRPKDRFLIKTKIYPKVLETGLIECLCVFDVRFISERLLVVGPETIGIIVSFLVDILWRLVAS